ncbi:MAG: FliA/WhiG family RNA polymerase sigma factor [Planctomycetota bacterium]|nr:MAG: FliA/WhiG family RNA polymerase sigma factor [Planctomycetota bacterium]
MPKRRPAASSTTAPGELTTEELWERFKDHGEKDLKKVLIERHQPLVRYVAERICATLPKSVDVDDLIQEGNFGLMDAINKFDHQRGIKFKTYCSARIRGAILDALRSQDWVPRLVRQRASRLEAIQRQWMSQCGREPTQAELAEALQVEEGQVPKEVGKARPHNILNVSDRRTPPGEDNESQLESLAESAEVNPADLAHRKDLMEVLTRTLTPKETRILRLYYLQGLTLREIGEKMELTESRVCQIHSNVIKRLRKRLQSTDEHFQA